MAAPAFWEDNRRAQELIRERTDLARTITRTTQLATQASDLNVLLELATEAGDDGSLDAEIAEGVARLKKELDEFARQERQWNPFFLEFYKPRDQR